MICPNYEFLDDSLENSVYRLNFGDEFRGWHIHKAEITFRGGGWRIRNAETYLSGWPTLCAFCKGLVRS